MIFEGLSLKQIKQNFFGRWESNFKAINYFRKKLHLRCLTWFEIGFWLPRNLGILKFFYTDFRLTQISREKFESWGPFSSSQYVLANHIYLEELLLVDPSTNGKSAKSNEKENK